MGEHVYSKGGVLGSNPTIPKFLPNVFAAPWQLLRNAPWKENHSRYITLFLKGTYSMLSFYELMGVSLAGVKHVLRYRGGGLRLFSWSY